MSESTPATEQPECPYLHRGRDGKALLDVHVMPNADQTRIDGLHGSASDQVLKIRLNAPPVDGKANAALVKWLASTLGVRQQSIEVVRGQARRRKRIRIAPDAAPKANWAALAA